MKNPFDSLKNWQTPPPSESAQRRALEESLRTLRSTKVEKAVHRFSFSPITAYGFAVALSLLLSAVLWKTYQAVKPDPVLNANTLAQFQSLFGSSLDALIERNGRIEVETAETPQPKRGQPVLITAKTAAGPLQIVSFSGSEFELVFGKERLRIEPLIAADGSVLLCSDQFVWSHGQKTGSLPDDLKTLQAVPLPPTT